jgi:Ulp1 family protease
MRNMGLKKNMKSLTYSKPLPKDTLTSSKSNSINTGRPFSVYKPPSPPRTILKTSQMMSTAARLSAVSRKNTRKNIKEIPIIVEEKEEENDEKYGADEEIKENNDQNNNNDVSRNDSFKNLESLDNLDINSSSSKLNAQNIENSLLNIENNNNDNIIEESNTQLENNTNNNYNNTTDKLRKSIIPEKFDLELIIENDGKDLLSSNEQNFLLNKIIICTNLSNSKILNDSNLILVINNRRLLIKDINAQTKINVPYHTIKAIKVPFLDARRSTSTIVLILNSSIVRKVSGYETEIEEIGLYLQKSWSPKQFSYFKKLVGNNILVGKLDSRETLTYYNQFDFKPTSSEKFYNSGKSASILKTKSPTILSSFSPTNTSRYSLTPPLPIPKTSIETDFSSLNRKERSHRTRSAITYQNEDLEDEKANEQMVMDNGETKLIDYIPPGKQIYFSPDLKYKLTNKKTFTITNDDFKCLYNGNWINDTLVDFFLSYSLQLAKEKKIPKVDKIEILNSFFFTSLSRPTDDENYYKNVKSWFKMNDTLFDQNFVIIPIMQDLHWYFVIITDLKLLKRKHTRLKNKENKENKEDDLDGSSIFPQNDNTVQDEIADIDENKRERSKSPKLKDININESPISISVNEKKKKINSKFVKYNQFGFDNNNDDFNDDDEDFKPEKVVRTAQICILDSLRRNHEQAIIYLKHFLIGYAAEKYGFDIKASEIVKKVCMVPQQKNFNDCGVHVLFNVDTMLNDPTSFDKIILKRPSNRKYVQKARRENQIFFDANKRLNLRDEIRVLLVDLLKKQVETNGGNLSEVCNMSVREKELLDLKNDLIPKETIDDNDGSSNTSGNIGNNGNDNNILDSQNGSNGKSNNENNNEHTEKEKRKGQEEGGKHDEDEEEDDDLIIVHVQDKESLQPELELGKVLPATNQLNHSVGRKPNSEIMKKSESEPIMDISELRAATVDKKDEDYMTGMSEEESSDEKMKKIPPSPRKLIAPKKRKYKQRVVVKQISPTRKRSRKSNVNLESDTEVTEGSQKNKRKRRGKNNLSNINGLADYKDENLGPDILSQDTYHGLEGAVSPINFEQSDTEVNYLQFEIDQEVRSSPTPNRELYLDDTESAKKLIHEFDRELNDDLDDNQIDLSNNKKYVNLKEKSGSIEIPDSPEKTTPAEKSSYIDDKELQVTSIDIDDGVKDSRDFGDSKMVKLSVNSVEDSEEKQVSPIISAFCIHADGNEKINQRLRSTTKASNRSQGLNYSHPISIDDEHHNVVDKVDVKIIRNNPVKESNKIYDNLEISPVKLSNEEEDLPPPSDIVIKKIANEIFSKKFSLSKPSQKQSLVTTKLKDAGSNSIPKMNERVPKGNNKKLDNKNLDNKKLDDKRSDNKRLSDKRPDDKRNPIELFKPTAESIVNGKSSGLLSKKLDNPPRRSIMTRSRSPKSLYLILEENLESNTKIGTRSGRDRDRSGSRNRNRDLEVVSSSNDNILPRKKRGRSSVKDMEIRESYKKQRSTDYDRRRGQRELRFAGASNGYGNNYFDESIVISESDEENENIVKTSDRPNVSSFITVSDEEPSPLFEIEDDN